MRERVEIFASLIKLQTLIHSLDTVASRVGQMIVLAIGGYMVMSGETTIGTLYAFYVYLDMLTSPMMNIPFLFMTGQQAFVSIDRVEGIRGFPVGEHHATGSRLDEIREIEFDQVTFGYDDSRATIEKISFRVPLGGKIAVVGPIASGKSTLLKMVASGKCCINRRIYTTSA